MTTTIAITELGARVRLSRGQLSVTDGPFTETKEVVGGYAQFELKSKEEAIESAVRFMELHKQHWPGWERQEYYASRQIRDQGRYRVSPIAFDHSCAGSA